jgi:hypothetical protein
MLLWQTKSNVWARFRLVKTDSGFVVKASQSYFLACGLPNSLPEGVLAWPGSYLPEEIELLWETVTRFGNLRDFGAKWEHSPGNGRRIWTGIAVPTQGIPPTAGGGVPSL